MEEIRPLFALDCASHSANSVCYQGACSTVKNSKPNVPSTLKPCGIQAAIKSAHHPPALLQPIALLLPASL